MKKLFTSIVCFLFLSCQNEIKEEKFFRAISNDKNDTAYLKISEIDNQFIGKYLIIYKDKTFDLGNISGEIIGDTLKGRKKYISRRNSEFTKPIAFLKENEILKLGNGMVSYYAQIPFFADGTIQFPDSLFQFYPIKSSDIGEFNKKFKFYKKTL